MSLEQLPPTNPDNYIQLPLTKKDKMHILSNDPLFRTGTVASIRTGINILLGMTDIIPGVSLTLTLPIKAVKIISHASKTAKVVRAFTGVNLSALDVTPDVPLRKVVHDLVFREAPTVGIWPSHIMHAREQYGFDKPRMSQALERLLAIWRA